MNKTCIKLVLLIVLLPLLTSCYSQTELNEMMIATAIGVDKSPLGYEVTLQVLNPTEVTGTSGKTAQSGISCYSESGETFFHAIRCLTHVTPRKIFLGHIRFVLFSEEVSQDGIIEPLDFLMRDHEMRSDFALLVSKDISAKNVLEVLSPIEQIPANKIMNSLLASEDFFGPSLEVELETFYQHYLSGGIEPVMNGITVLGNAESGKEITSIEQTTPKAVLKVAYIALFKKDTFIGWLNETESLGFNYLINEIDNTVIVAMTETGAYTFEVTKAETKIELVKPPSSFNVITTLNVTLGEALTGSVKGKEGIDQLTSLVEAKVRHYMSSCVDRLQEEQTDNVGFGQVLNKKAPSVWKDVEKEWDTLFPTISVGYQVDVKMTHNGQLSDDESEDEG